VYSAFIGNEQNVARVGSGLFFLTSELLLFAALAYFGKAIHQRRVLPNPYLDLTLYSIVFIMTLVMTVAISSRRMIATFVLCLIVLFSLKNPRQWWLPLSAIGSTFLLSPVLQIIRYLDVGELLAGSIGFWESFSNLRENRFFLTTISSSFEGVDHLAQLIQKGGISGILFGFDGGVAWIFNAGLALIPRAIWSNKPLIYGSIAEQFYLYPEMYNQGAATVTLPPSFIVDFLFGFGIVIGLGLCFLMGRFFAILSEILWGRGGSSSLSAIALFTFVNIFNFVRSGTGMIPGLTIFLGVCSFVLGFRETCLSAIYLFKRTLGLQRSSILILGSPVLKDGDQYD